MDSNKEHETFLLEKINKHYIEMRPENLTCNMIINDLGRLVEYRVNKVFERNGVSFGYRRIIFHLAHHDAMTQSELTKHAHLTAPSVSNALQKLESDGYVIRKTDEQDKRIVRVYLTEKGRELDRSIITKLKETEELMMDGIDPEEMEALKMTLLKLVNNMIKEL